MNITIHHWSRMTGRLVPLPTREELLRPVADEIIAGLSKIPNRDEKSIHGEDVDISVNDMIKDLRELTPRGIELTEAWMRSKASVALLLRERRIKRWAWGALILGLGFLAFAPYTPARVLGAVVAFLAGIMLFAPKK